MKRFYTLLLLLILFVTSLMFTSQVSALSYTDTFSFDNRDYYIIDFQTKIEYYEIDALTSSNYYYTTFNSNGTNILNWYDNNGNYDLTDLYFMIYYGYGFAPNTMILDNKLYIDILTISSPNPIYFMIKMNNGNWVSTTQTTLYTMNLIFELDYDTYICSYCINGYDINGAFVYSSGLFGSAELNLGIAVSFESDFMNYNEGYKNGFENGELVSWNDGYDKGLDDGYDDGLDAGYNRAMSDIFYNGFSVDSGYNQTQSRPYRAGFNAGIETNIDFSFTGLLAQIFTGLGSFLSIELLPNISFGAIIAIPIVFGVIMFIIGRRKE